MQEFQAPNIKVRTITQEPKQGAEETFSHIIKFNSNISKAKLTKTSNETQIIEVATSFKNKFQQLTMARKAIKLFTDKYTNVAIYAHTLKQGEEYQQIEPLVSAILASNTQMPSFKSKPQEAIAAFNITVFCQSELNFETCQAINTGNGLARFLTILPANKLNPGNYRDYVKKLAKTEAWDFEYLDMKKLNKLGAEAFLAVANGSPHQDAGIAHCRYTPKGADANTKKLCLVGKGICYDTGGYQLKEAEYMHGMHIDMNGSAVALGTLLALSKLKVPYIIDCYLAIADNHIGGSAYHPNQVVKALNGISIETIHTDAEGRMVLADTLALASQDKPQLILNYATLTGASIRSLGQSYSAIFSNNENLNTTLIDAGKTSGERVWPFPMDDDYFDALKSKIADTKQCEVSGPADHIYAAKFLTKFIPKTQEMVHLDLSSARQKGGLAHVDTNITGFGVRFSVHALLQTKLGEIIQQTHATGSKNATNLRAVN